MRIRSNHWINRQRDMVNGVQSCELNLTVPLRPLSASALLKAISFSALCRSYGISRDTGYKWLGRHLSGQGMEDQSRRPFHTPSRIPEEMESRIVAMRKKEPAVGALKLRQMLLNEGCVKPPSASTINEVFRRNGLITREASLNASPVKRFEKEAPNMAPCYNFGQ